MIISCDFVACPRLFYVEDSFTQLFYYYGSIFYPGLIGVSKFLGTLSNSLRDNISHVTAAAAVTSDGPEPVFDRMQVFVESGVVQF